MELGITTFADAYPIDGVPTPHGVRLRQVLEEVELAERVGLDVYGIGEHHRADFAASAPTVVLAAAAARTEKIRLTSAVTVLSSADPVRVWQEFTTLDLISRGRAEVMAGRGSFIESFPLFGYDLEDYDDLFAEKLDLLVELTREEKVTWSGRFRPALHEQGVFPRPERTLPVWVAVGGTPQSIVRAAQYGLPVALAIIGGQPAQFGPLAQLHRHALKEAGHTPEQAPLAVHMHGYVAPTAEQAVEEYYPSYAQAMTQLGRERGWGAMTRNTFNNLRGRGGSLVLGTPEQVAEKIVDAHRLLGIQRFMLHISVGTLPHEQVLRAIELLGTQVAPLVKAELGG
ncbi:LLM class flavin-dependent oxidoreductase [Kineosporia sp. J2-2]|uniref:LLM class flavin-dependent oxidoreductase n=1 Tax=Kineosporia corallincola TaxID=2835133 RepID=A0ABS5TCB0_9ACTN|nr:LLM class flavin-dependent oxidoreductase [Kineosporia corallincola]MBT0768059.1 LLM class flavin-dependent oxidoreductase [Kineosporia corallincola]